MIAIIDNHYNNLKSLANALDFLNISFNIIKAENLNEDYSHLIIPGVGNFASAMSNLKKNSGDKKIINFANKKKPVMGICLGMQLLGTISDESGPVKGLDLIPGNIKKINVSSKFHLPHIGWNSVKFKLDHQVLNGIKDEMDYYFVHSYCFNLTNQNYKIGITIYENEFNSIVGKENVIGFQFHPEKSQKYGLKILNNFYSWKY